MACQSCAIVAAMTLQSLFDQAVALHQKCHYAEAERQYLQVLAANPQIYQAQYLLALLRVQQQRFSEAEPAMEAALSLNPRAPEALTLQGVLRKAAGRREAALASYDRLLALYPDHFETWFARGSLLLELKRFDAALTSFDKALAGNPASPLSLERSRRGAARPGALSRRSGELPKGAGDPSRLRPRLAQPGLRPAEAQAF